MKGKFIVYSLVVSLACTIASWNKALSGNSFSSSSSSSSGSRWSSNSGGSSWGGGGGSHK
jgi:hypothetical protein